MPNIAQYNAIGELQPSDKGIQAAEVAGRRIGLYGHQLEQDADQIGAKITQHDANMEVSHGSAIGATAYSGFTTSLNAVVTHMDANDQSAIPKWKQEVFEPWANDFVGQFKTPGGQVWARNYVDSMRQHFTEAAIADQSTMAGVAARQNYQQAVVGLTSTVFQDPTALNASLSAYDSTIEHAKDQPNISPREVAQLEDERVKTRGDIVESAVRGMIMSGQPGIDMARKNLADPTWMKDELSGDQRALLSGRADEQERRLQEQAKVAQEAGQKQAVLDLKGKVVALTTTLSDKLASGQPLTAEDLKARDALVTSPFAGDIAGNINEVNSLIRESQRPNTRESYVQTNPHVSADLLGRLTVPAGAPGAITEAELLKDYKDGTISQDDYAKFHEALPKASGDPAMKAALERLKAWQAQFRGQIEGPGGTKPGGATAYNQFIHDSTFQFMNWAKAENDPGRALDITTNATNPRSFNRMVPEYVSAANYPDPMARLNSIPGYGHLAGVAEGSTVSPIAGPAQPRQAAAAPAGSAVSAARMAELARMAGGH